MNAKIMKTQFFHISQNHSNTFIYETILKKKSMNANIMKMQIFFFFFLPSYNPFNNCCCSILLFKAIAKCKENILLPSRVRKSNNDCFF